MSEHHNYVINRLIHALRNHAKGGRLRRMIYKTLPLSTDAMLDHVELKKIMSPPVPDEGIFTEQLFDAFVFPLKDQYSTPEEGLRGLGACTLANWVSVGTSVEDQVVRLLFALSNASGATCTYDRTSFMVTHGDVVYGVKDCVAISRFCTGMSLKIRPLPLMDSDREAMAYDANFCSLYREACRKGRGLTNALVALQVGDPKFDFRRMAECAVPTRFPSRAKLKQWETILVQDEAPIPILFKKMVPRWLTLTQFTKIFGQLNRGKLRVTTTTKIINAMHAFFYKNNKEWK